MERDDAGSFARLRGIRERIVDPKIAEHGGRVVKTAGDGMLLEFGSADAALRCAIDVQRAMRADNQSKPSDERIEFRIGINLGDIIVDGNDIAGDGVNVAARLEALAEPGGICVSAAVREQVHGSLDVGFEDIGDQQVKNIMRPIRVFAVTLDSASIESPSMGHVAGALSQMASSASAARRRLPLTKSTAVVAAAGVIGLVVATLSVLWWNSRNDAPPPPAMSVTVMPMVAPTGDTAMAQRAESLTRDVASMLTLTSTAIRVVPVPLTQTVENRRDIDTTARTLNVRYVVEGDVRLGQGTTLISLRLLNGATSEQLWSETVSFKDTDSAHDQRHVMRAAVNHLGNVLLNVEIRRVMAQPHGNATAMDYVLRANSLWETEPHTLQRARKQEELFEAALRLDPNLIPALNGLFFALSDELDNDIHLDRQRTIRRMDECTSRAVNLNGLAPENWIARARALMLMGQWDASVEAIAKAIRLDPDSSLSLSQSALLTILIGKPSEALAIVEQVIAMDPPGGWDAMMNACFAHILLRQHELAVGECEKVKGLSVEDWTVHLFLAAAYAQRGDIAKAAAAREEVLRRVPGYTISILRSKAYSVNPEYMRLVEENVYPALRKAGFREE